MTRMSKQGKLRNISKRRPRLAGPKTGPKRDQLEYGHKVHENALTAESVLNRFIPKIG